MRNLHMVPWELATLAELLDLYIYIYEPESVSPEDLLEDVKERIASVPSNTYTAKNPRGAGRHPSVTDDQRKEILRLRGEAKSIRQISFLSGLSIGTVHKLIHEHEHNES